jgi:hypothetical protein
LESKFKEEICDYVVEASNKTYMDTKSRAERGDELVDFVGQRSVKGNAAV